MTRRRSLATWWTVRYALLTLLAISLLGALIYHRVGRALRDDATLLLELEANELIAEMRQHPGEDTEELAEMIAPDVASAHPDLKVTIQVFDAGGRLLHARGLSAARSLPLAEEVRAGEESSRFREVDLGDSYPYWVYAARGRDDELVQVAIYARPFIRGARHIRDVFLTALPVAVLVSAGLGFVISRSSLRPVSSMVRSAQAITSENLKDRIPHAGTGDEFDRIADAFNGVLDRIESTVEALRRFSADAAHQLRTPLTAMRGRMEVALETEPLPEDLRVLLEELVEQVRHLSGMVDSLLALARLEEGLDPSQCRDVPLFPLLESVVDFLEPLAAEQELCLELQKEAGATVFGDRFGLDQVFLNLVENALRYTPKGGRIDVILSRDGADAVVRVRDTGRGIPQAELPHVFERFHRSAPDPSLPGAGLGLTLARQLAEAHGGRIEAESTPGVGSTFTVRLPLTRRSP